MSRFEQVAVPTRTRCHARATSRCAIVAEQLESRCLLSAATTDAIASLAVQTDRIKATAKPAPAPPAPLYQAVKIAAGDTGRVAIDDIGRTIWGNSEGIVVWTPTDANSDGIWEGGTSFTLPKPDFAAFGMDLETGQRPVVSDTTEVLFGPGGAIAARFWARAYEGSVQVNATGRVFLYLPTTAPGGQLTYGNPINLGMPHMEVPVAPEGKQVLISVRPSSFEGDGTIKGMVQFPLLSGGILGTHYFRLIPQNIDGTLTWRDSTEGANNLMELRPETGHVDDFGREYASRGDFNYDLILPDGRRTLVGPESAIKDSNTAGRITGTIIRNDLRNSPRVPCYIDGVDTNGDGQADTWYRDEDGVPGNDLLVYMDLRDNMAAPYISGINEQGVAVGKFTAYGSKVSPATMWRDAVAVDLKTITSVQGNFTSATAINDNGVIHAVAYYNGVYTSYLLVPPPVKAATMTTTDTVTSGPVKLSGLKAADVDAQRVNVLLQSSATPDSLYDLGEPILA